MQTKRPVTQWGKERLGWTEGSSETYRLSRGKQTASGKLLCNTWSSTQGSTKTQEWWDEVGGEREVPEGAGMFIADSSGCMAETNTTF